MSRPRSFAGGPVSRAALILLGVLLAMGLLELGLRLGGWLYGSVDRRENDRSARAAGAYRILCLGESTTARLDLRRDVSYPRQLERILNERRPGSRFVVINQGIPGIHTSYILENLEGNLERYRPDLVITMMGVNDGEAARAADGILGRFRVYKLLKWLRDAAVAREDALARAGRLMREAKYVEAEEAIQGVLKRDPGDERAQAVLQEIYFRWGRFAQAEEAMKEAIRRNPDPADASLALAQVYGKRGRYREAEALLEQVIHKHPSRQDAYIALSQIYAQQGKTKEGKAILSRSVRNGAVGGGPVDARAYARLSEAYRLGRADPRDSGPAEPGPGAADPDLDFHYSERTIGNYRNLRETLRRRGVPYVCMQYPVRSLRPLKAIFGDDRDILFVDNEPSFKRELKRKGYPALFEDLFAFDFGHCTAAGNALIAENAAEAILSKGVPPR